MRCVYFLCDVLHSLLSVFYLRILWEHQQSTGKWIKQIEMLTLCQITHCEKGELDSIKSFHIVFDKIKDWNFIISTFLIKKENSLNEWKFIKCYFICQFIDNELNKIIQNVLF